MKVTITNLPAPLISITYEKKRSSPHPHAVYYLEGEIETLSIVPEFYDGKEVDLSKYSFAAPLRAVFTEVPTDQWAMLTDRPLTYRFVSSGAPGECVYERELPV